MNVTKSFIYGVLIGVLGIVLFSSKAVMVKLAYNYNVDAISILLLRMLFSFPFYLIIALSSRKKKPSVKQLKMIFYGFCFLALWDTIWQVILILLGLLI